MSDPFARNPGAILRAYLIATRAATPLLKRHLRRRLARGKELPDRWREKLGEPDLPRPEGTLIWMHAVGLGEVLALRGLITRMTAIRPDLQFLVTSGTRASAEVFGQNLPPACRHQFLPLDAPAFATRFLDHWRPDLSIWAEQDLWPGLVWAANRRAIPLALVNARMNAAAFRARRRVRPLFADLYRRFALLSAQDADTARHLAALGAPAPVTVTGSLKPFATPLNDPSQNGAHPAETAPGRPVWLAASTHPADEALALAAHRLIRSNDPAALLILAPRLPERRDEIAAACKTAGLPYSLRSAGSPLRPDDAVYIADTFGEMGLWYRRCPVAFIGGSAADIGGHNPWEAVHLGSAVLHGSDTANFRDDYAALHAAQAARQTTTPQALAAAVQDPDVLQMPARARHVAAQGMEPLNELCHNLIALLTTAHKP